MPASPDACVPRGSARTDRRRRRRSARAAPSGAPGRRARRPTTGAGDHPPARTTAAGPGARMLPSCIRWKSIKTICNTTCTHSCSSLSVQMQLHSGAYSVTIGMTTDPRVSKTCMPQKCRTLYKSRTALHMTMAVTREPHNASCPARDSLPCGLSAHLLHVLRAQPVDVARRLAQLRALATLITLQLRRRRRC